MNNENENNGLSPELARLLSPEYEREREEKRRLAKRQRERMERNLEEAKRLRESARR
jgi:hypothetical protein